MCQEGNDLFWENENKRGSSLFHILSGKGFEEGKHETTKIGLKSLFKSNKYDVCLLKYRKKRRRPQDNFEVTDKMSMDRLPAYYYYYYYYYYYPRYLLYAGYVHLYS